jgi:hypothetical protein
MIDSITPAVLVAFSAITGAEKAGSVTPIPVAEITGLSFEGAT